MMTNRQMSSWRSIGYWPVFFSYQRVATVTTMRNSLPDPHFRSLHFGLLMTKTVRLIAVFLSCYITLGYANSALSQERLRIDNDTVAVVESPWRLMNVNTKANLRGLHVYSSDDVWASGSQGTIINTFDGGENWHVRQVPGAEELDFRDVHAIDDGTVVAITSGTPARVYRSTSGGSNWSLVYENNDERVFLDSVCFLDDRRGIIMGDPIKDGLYLLATRDGGKTWRPFKEVPRVLPGEAGFAASGTNMIATQGKKVFIGLGSHLEGESSLTSRILFTVDSARSWKKTNVPIARSPSAGIFSICFANKENGVAVGGDYKRPDDSSSNFAVTNDGGVSWSTPTLREPPTGFRSCVSVWLKYGREINMIAVGPNGTDRSTDLGKKWHRISNEGFHAVDFAPDGQFGWAVGANGRIAQWQGIVNGRVRKAPEAATKPGGMSVLRK